MKSNIRYIRYERYEERILSIDINVPEVDGETSEATMIIGETLHNEIGAYLAAGLSAGEKGGALDVVA